MRPPARRMIAAAALALAGVATALTAQPMHGTHEPRTYDEGIIPRFSFEIIEIDARGSVGVAVLDASTGKASAWRGDDRVPLNSTVKLLMCAAVLMRVDAGAESLARPIAVTAADLVAHSPVLEGHVGSALTVGELCHAAMTRSDNGAANLLMATLGGPAGLTALLREAGDAVTRVDRGEPGLNDGPPGDERDTTTPRAMLENLQRFLLGPTLTTASRATLRGWMEANTTGDARIRAGVPGDWTVGDRTGTGPDGTTSTVAILSPPRRAPVLMAIYVVSPSLSAAEAAPIHAELARIAARNVLLDAEGFFD